MLDYRQMKSLGTRRLHHLLLDPQQVSDDGERRRLHGEQVVVVHVRAAAPHELGQAEQVLQVVARLAAAHRDLGADLLRAGRAQVEGVVGRGDVEHRLHRRLALVVGVEVHHLGGVAAAHRLAHVQVLEGLLHLSARHLEGHAPGARLQGKEEEEKFNGRSVACTASPKPEDVGLSTYVIILDKRHHSSGLWKEGRNGLSHGPRPTLEASSAQATQTHQASYQLVVAAVEVVSVPKTPLVAVHVADHAPPVLEVGLPYQGAVAEDPQAGLPRHDVLRLHSDR